MLSFDDGEKAVRFARSVAESYVINGEKNSSHDLDDIFNQNQGAFVTFHTYPDYGLRGCVGIPLPVMSLKDAIKEGATSATHDPRFLPLSKDELDKIIIEVTILTPPELIEVDKAEDYLENIIIGRDGLIVEQGFYKGLLLPQVPVEQDWDKEEFLSHTCMKAGLHSDAWFDKNTKISKFTGQIFTEIKPRGKIEEKKIDGSNS